MLAPSVIDQRQIETMVREVSDRGWLDFQDNHYRTTSLWRWRLILRAFKWVAKIPYVGEYFDCDDFASLLRVVLRFTGLTAVGEVTGDWIGYGSHAWTVIVARDGLIWLEPQLMKEVNPKHYSVRSIRI